MKVMVEDTSSSAAGDAITSFNGRWRDHPSDHYIDELSIEQNRSLGNHSNSYSLQQSPSAVEDGDISSRSVPALKRQAAGDIPASRRRSEATEYSDESTAARYGIAIVKPSTSHLVTTSGDLAPATTAVASTRGVAEKR